MSCSAFASLDAAGLNLQALFDLKQLPAPVLDSLGLEGEALQPWRQLLLLGHGGRQMWQQLHRQQGAPDPDGRGDPIDSYTVAQVEKCLAGWPQPPRYKLLYPSSQPLALQALGALAGWHHPSPFRVGVNQRWGSWFAYRAVVLTDTQFTPFSSVVGGEACAGCSRPCVTACAGQVLSEASEPGGCIRYRLQADSPCAEACPARQACPVARVEAYSLEQQRYHYRQSLWTLRHWAAQQPGHI